MQTQTMVAKPEENAPPQPVAWWHWHRRLYDWVIHWADTRFGVPALIVLAIVEPVCVPIPADVLVIGLSMGKPQKAIHYGLLCSVFSVVGGTIAFLLGLAIGPERVVAFFEQVSVGPLQLGEKAQLALDYYQRYDFWAIAISALTPVPYMLFSWVGGMAEVSLVKFIGVSLIFRAMRFGGEGVLFRLFGQRARQLIEKYFNTATIIAIVVLALLVYLIRKLGHLFG
jgi:membrane protein YqaA with SNARE-associated domain